MATGGDRKDLLAGLIFLGIGSFGAFQSTRYEIGTAREMGSGYMPLGVFALLAALGAAIAVRGARAELRAGLGAGLRAVPMPRLRPLLLVVLATSAFALLLRGAGFFAATLVLVTLASFADSDARWREALVAGVVLALFGVAVFSLWLGVPLPTWPWSD
jgi:hypothetical protein